MFGLVLVLVKYKQEGFDMGGDRRGHSPDSRLEAEKQGLPPRSIRERRIKIGHREIDHLPDELDRTNDEATKKELARSAVNSTFGVPLEDDMRATPIGRRKIDEEIIPSSGISLENTSEFIIRQAQQ